MIAISPALHLLGAIAWFSILGHSTPTVTPGVYGHVVAGAEANAVETIAVKLDTA